MAYAVYYKHKGSLLRASELTIAKSGRFKGSEISKDLRFETFEEAQEKAKYYESLGHETRIKEIK